MRHPTLTLLLITVFIKSKYATARLGDRKDSEISNKANNLPKETNREKLSFFN